MRYLRKPAIIAALAAGAFGVAQSATANRSQAATTWSSTSRARARRPRTRPSRRPEASSSRRTPRSAWPRSPRRIPRSSARRRPSARCSAPRTTVRSATRPPTATPAAGHRARRPGHQGQPGKIPAPAPADEPLAGLPVGHADDRRDRRRAPIARSRAPRRPRRHHRHRRRRLAPRHRAELRLRADPQLHRRRPDHRRPRAPTSPTTPARTRPTSTKTATARTSPARSARAINGLGIAGVAPSVDIVNLRAGQDSGYFFLQPTVDALTYAGDHGIDVVNMSFYIDPWLYNCAANPADSPGRAGRAAHDHRGHAARAELCA